MIMHIPSNVDLFREVNSSRHDQLLAGPFNSQIIHDKAELKIKPRIKQCQTDPKLNNSDMNDESLEQVSLIQAEERKFQEH